MTIRLMPWAKRTTRPHAYALVAWAIVPACLRAIGLSTQVPGTVTTFGFVLMLALGFWLIGGVLLLAWGCVVERSPREAFWLTPAAFVVAILLSFSMGAVALPLKAFAIRRAFVAEMKGVPPARGISLDGDFWFDDMGVLVGETPIPGTDNVELDLNGVWWSDDGKHVVPSGRTVLIPMATCDFCRAYPLGDGWWFLHLNN